MTESDDSANSTSVEAVDPLASEASPDVSDHDPANPDATTEARQTGQQSTSKLRSAAGRAVSAAPQPVQDALTRASATAQPVLDKAQPVLEKAKPHSKKIALALGGSLLIVIVTARRRRRGSPDRGQ